MTTSSLSQTIEIHIDPEVLVENATETIAYVMVAIFMMNVFDAVATTFWVVGGYATEANPLMDVLIQTHPTLFVVVKLALIALGLSMLWLKRHHWLSRAGTVAIFAVYAALSIYHVSAIGFVIDLV